MNEPSGEDTLTVDIPIVRSGGDIGVVAVDWQATLNGIYGNYYFASSQYFSLEYNDDSICRSLFSKGSHPVSSFLSINTAYKISP